MEFIQKFKDYLLSQKNAPSKATVKNYLADIHHFISWVEATYQKVFNPQDITIHTIEQFKEAKKQTLSQSSIDRHVSTLRKFFIFLTLTGEISHSPFEEAPSKAETREKEDPWHLHDFKNYLYVYNASHLTIKNYLIDVKQFLSWAETVLGTKDAFMVADKDVLKRIDSSLAEEYKTRLIEQHVFSASSINRKLSSLRKYLSWAAEQGYMAQEVDLGQRIQESGVKNTESNTGWQEGRDSVMAELPIQRGGMTGDPARVPGLNLSEGSHRSGVRSDRTPESQNNNSQPQKYSKIPPVRLFQKTTHAGTFAFDLLISRPIAHLFRTTAHKKWELQGKPLFVKAPTGFMGKTKHVIPQVKNISKELYSPLSISIKHLPWYRQALHHIRYTRPTWYRRYHQLALAHYFNWAVLIIFSSAVGFGMYHSFVQTPGKSLAALPNGPLRVLSFQGRLTDANDNPITTPTYVRFAIYNDATASGSAEQWEELDKVTPDSDGIFSLLLGSNGSGGQAATCSSTPATGACGIPQSLFANNNALWLGVTVGNTSELTPREQIATVAFASNAETLQGLPPITQSGAGTQNVVLALNSSGNLAIGASTTFQSTSGQFALSGNTLALNTNAGTNGNITLAPDGTGIVDIQKPIQNTSNYGNIPSAAGAVEIDDLLAVLATSSGQSAFTLNQNSTGPLISASTSGTAKFTVDNAGNTYATAFYPGLGSTYVINTATSSLNSLTLASNLTVSGNVASNLTPSVTDTYNLGSATNEWNNLYVKNIIAGSSGISGFWQLNLGVISPTNSSNDLAIGGTATSSAKFQLFGNTGNATTSGNLTFAGGSGSNVIAARNNAGLTIGDSQTGNIILNGGNVGIGTTNPQNTLDISTTGANNGLRIRNTSVGSLNTAAFILDRADQQNGYAQMYLQTGDVSDWLIGTYAGSKDIRFYNYDFGGTIMTLQDTTGNVGIGTTTPTALLDVNGTASVSSELAFRTGAASIQATADNTLTLGGNTTGAVSFGSNIASNILPNLTNTYNLGSSSLQWNNIYGNNIYSNGQLLSQLWQLNSGVISPLYSSNDLAIGGTATSSAKFQLFGNTGNATTSGNLTFAGGSGSNVIAARNNAGLTIGDSQTGNITFTGNGNVGIGTSNPSSKFQVIGDTSNTAAGPVVISANGATNSIGTALTLDASADSGGKSLSFISTGPGASAGAGSFAIYDGTDHTYNFLVNSNGQYIAGINQYTSAGQISAYPYNASTVGLAIVGAASQTANYFNVTSNGGTAGNIFTIQSNGTVGIGTATPLSQTGLDIEKNSQGNAALIANQTGSGDILTASSSGTTQFTVSNAGAIYGRSLYDLDNTAYYLDPASVNTALTVAGSVGIGTSSPTPGIGLDIQKNSPAAAALRVNQLAANQDIFTASASGTPKFTIAYNGNLSATGTITGLTGITSSGTIDFTGLSTNGVLQTSGGNGTLTVAAVNLGTEVTGVLPLSNGGTGANLTANAGGIVYSGSSSLAILAPASTANQCLVSGGGTNPPAWASCSSGTSGGYWSLNNGALYPVNTTLDLFVGGTATSSAKFAVFNMNSGTPTASVSATATGTGLSLGGDGTIQSLINSPLTLGGNTTGSIILAPQNGTGTVSIHGSTLDTNASTFSLLPSATTVNIGGSTIDSTQSTVNLFTTPTTLNLGGSSQALTIKGNTTIGNSSSNTLTITSQINSNVIPYTASGNTSSYSLGDPNHMWQNIYAANIYAPVSGGTNGFWSLANNVIYPANYTSNDLAIGGTATSSAQFQVFAETVGTTTAGTASTSGNLVFHGTNAAINLLNGNSLTVNASVGGDSALSSIVTISNSGDLSLNGNLTVTGGTISSTALTNNIFTGSAGTINIGKSSTTVNIPGNVTLGTTSGNNLTINGDIASNLVPLTDNNYYIGNTTNQWEGIYTHNLYLPASGGTDGYWTLSNSVVSPTNIWNDLAVGGTATSSAKFQIFGNTGNATTSGTLTFAGGTGANIIAARNMAGLTIGDSQTGNIILNGANVGIGTTNPLALVNISKSGGNQLLLTNTNGGNGSVVDVQFQTYTPINGTANPGADIEASDDTHFSANLLFLTKTPGGNTNSLAERMRITDAGGVGIGTGNTVGNAQLVVNQTGLGDIFSASSSGTTKFTIANDGTIKNSIIPNLTDTYNLGSSTNEWNNLYVRQIITPSTGGIAGYWQLNSGVLSPSNITNDLAVGGTATSSAKFQIFGNTGNATTSGTLTFAGGTGANIIAARNMAGLTIGDSQTGNIILNGANVGIGNTNPQYPLDISTSNTVASLNISTTGNSAYTGIIQALAPNLTTGNQSYIALGRNAATDNWASLGFTYTGNGSSNNRLDFNFYGTSPILSLLASGNVGIGTTSPQGVLDVASNATNLPSDLTLSQTSGTNYITNPSFEGGSTTGWSLSQGGSGGSISATTSASMFGRYSALITTGTAWTTLSNAGYTVSSSTQYTFSAWVKTSVASNAELDVYDSGTSTHYYSSIHPGDGKWHRLTDTFTTGSSTTSITPTIVTTGANGTLTYVDGIQLETTSSATPYIDGSLGPGYYWTGTPNSSTSKRAFGSAFTYDTLNSAQGIGAASLAQFPTLQLDQNGTGDIIAASASGTTQFKVTNNGGLYARTFYDLDNSAYYLDPASTGTSLTTAGSVGIGTTSPGYKLEVDSSGTNTTSTEFRDMSSNDAIAFIPYLGASGYNPVSNAGDQGIYAMNGNGLDLGVWSNNGGVHIGSNGETGIGTGSPDETLQVNGLAHIGTNQGSMGSPTTSNTNLILYNFGTSNWSGIGSDGGGAMYFAAGTSGVSSRMVITPSGNVGIGTTNPGSGVTMTGGLTINGTGGTQFTMQKSGTNGLAINIGQTTAGDVNLYDAVGGSFHDDLTLNNGNVGIGNTTSPSYTLDVSGTARVTSTTYLNGDLFETGVAELGINSTYNPGVISKLGVTWNNSGGSGEVDLWDGFNNANNSGHYAFEFLTESSGSPYGIADIRGDGSMHIRSGSGTYYTGGLDYAEYVTASDPSINAGDIVSPVSLTNHVATQSAKKSSVPYDPAMLGIISTHPGALFGTVNSSNPNSTDDTPSNSLPLALAGRVPTKVSTINGSIKVGDSITSSAIPGVGMKATRAGAIVGKTYNDFNPDSSTCVAVASYNDIPWADNTCYKTPDGVLYGKVVALVDPGWYDPQAYLTSTGDYMLTNPATPSADFAVPTYYTLSDALGNPISQMGAFVELVVGNLRAGSIQAQQTITNTLAIATDNVSIAGQSLKDYILSVVKNVGINTIAVSQNGQIQTDVISPLASGSAIAIRLNNSRVEIAKDATGSAVASIDNAGNATFSGELNSQNLAVNGDATVSGTLHANKIEANSIVGLQTLVSTLSAQNVTIINNNYVATPTATPMLTTTATGSGNLSSTTSAAPAISGAAGFANIASFSGYLSYVPSLQAATGMFEQGLVALGPTSLTDTSIQGQLSIGSQLILADNSLNVLGSDFAIQPLRQGGVTFEGGLVAINTNGDLTVNGNAIFNQNLAVNTLSPIPGHDLQVNLSNSAATGSAQPQLKINNASGSAVFAINQMGDLMASGAANISKLNFNLVQPAMAVSDTEVVATGSAGTASIKAFQKEVTIDDVNVTDKSLIYITPVGTDQTPYLERQVAGTSFTVGIPVGTPNTVNFNWLIVN